MDHNIQGVLKPLLSPNAHVLDCQRVDLKGLGVFEVLVAYEWRGHHYVVVLNNDQSEWRVVGTIDGSGDTFSCFSRTQ